MSFWIGDYVEQMFGVLYRDSVLLRRVGQSQSLR